VRLLDDVIDGRYRQQQSEQDQQRRLSQAQAAQTSALALTRTCM
jgi:hypothetical protein